MKGGLPSGSSKSMIRQRWEVEVFGIWIWRGKGRTERG